MVAFDNYTFGIIRVATNRNVYVSFIKNGKLINLIDLIYKPLIYYNNLILLILINILICIYSNLLLRLGVEIIPQVLVKTVLPAQTIHEVSACRFRDLMLV